MSAEKVDPGLLLRTKFKLAVQYANSAEAKASGGIDTQQQLRFYGLFKQATEGPCNEKSPSQINFVKYAKWQAWDDVKTLSKENAMRRYLDEMDKSEPNWKEVVKAAHQIKLRSKL